MGGRPLTGQCVFSYPKQRLLTLDTTEPSNFMNPSGMFCHEKNSKQDMFESSQATSGH